MVKSLIIIVVLAVLKSIEGSNVYNATCDQYAKHLSVIDYSINSRLEKEELNNARARNVRN